MNYFNYKISIIIPIYNVETYLRDCVDCIINQTYKNIEIILIDDGSTDNCLEICNQYSLIDSRIKVYHQNNNGVSCARNLGIEMSSGDYIVFVDSDDCICNNFIDSLIHLSEKGTLAACRWATFSDTLPIHNNYNDQCNTIIIEKNNFIELYKMQLLNTVTCKLFSKDIIIKNNIVFDDNISLGEDLLFNLSYLACIEKVAICQNVMYYYRVHINNSLTSKYRNDIKINQLYLIDCLSQHFKNISNFEELNQLRMEMLLVIVDNEFKNPNCNFFKRYLNSRRILKDKDIKNRLILYKKGYSKIKSFLLRKNMIISFKLVSKFF